MARPYKRTLYRLLRGVLLSLAPVFAFAQKPYERAPIDYETSEAIDPVSAYFSEPENLDAWKIEGSSGYLKSFLDAFDIPVESQVLVYSKTSLQAGRISPRIPRALYFNDEIYVGWVPGGRILEISAPNPTTGTNFYTINNSGERPALLRETHDCLRCHGGSFTRDVPGHLIRSVFPDASGQPIYKAGTTLVDQSTPIEQRWGGWLVTGPELPHHGNKIFEETDDGAAVLREFRIDEVPENGYMTRSSEIVALMVLEHQVEAHTLIAHLSIQARKALYDQAVMDKLLERTQTISDSTQRRIKHATDKLLHCLFYSAEVEIPRISLRDSAFAEAFQAAANRDAKGRSLHDLKMSGRMFEYPLSYLVYSNAVADLPAEAQTYLWAEVLRVLKSPADEPSYEHLSQKDKRAILEILQATHPRFSKETIPLASKS